MVTCAGVWVRHWFSAVSVVLLLTAIAVSARCVMPTMDTDSFQHCTDQKNINRTSRLSFQMDHNIIGHRLRHSASRTARTVACWIDSVEHDRCTCRLWTCAKVLKFASKINCIKSLLIFFYSFLIYYIKIIILWATQAKLTWPSLRESAQQSEY